MGFWHSSHSKVELILSSLPWNWVGFSNCFNQKSTSEVVLCVLLVYVIKDKMISILLGRIFVLEAFTCHISRKTLYCKETEGSYRETWDHIQGEILGLTPTASAPHLFQSQTQSDCNYMRDSEPELPGQALPTFPVTETLRDNEMSVVVLSH